MVRFHLDTSPTGKIAITILVNDTIHTVTTNIIDALNQAYQIGKKEKELETKRQSYG